MRRSTIRFCALLYRSPNGIRPVKKWPGRPGLTLNKLLPAPFDASPLSLQTLNNRSTLNKDTAGNITFSFYLISPIASIDSIQPTIFPTIKWAVPVVVSPDHTETVVVVVWVLLTTPLRRLRINYVASLWKIEIRSISSHLKLLPPFRVWFRQECAPVMHQLEIGLPRNLFVFRVSLQNFGLRALHLMASPLCQQICRNCNTKQRASV